MNPSDSYTTQVRDETIEACVHVLRGNFGAGRGGEALRQRDDDISILQTMLSTHTGPPPPPAPVADLQRVAQIIRDYCQHGVRQEPFDGPLDTADLAARAVLHAVLRP